MLRPLALSLIALPLLIACGDKDDTQAPEGDTDTDTDADTDTDSDTDADTDTDTDTDTDPVLGMVGYSGEAIGGYEGYEGFEEWFFVADEGDGDDICRIRYEVKDVGPRDDCPAGGHSTCIWSWDLGIAAAEILAESGMGCDGAFGLTADTVADLNGTTFAIGYNPDYYGHAAVMYRDMGEGWFVADFAVWNESTGEFSYMWDQGYIEY